MSTGIGEFFAIDRRAWHHVCSLGLNEAVGAYLVLARGTGPDNRTTAWSTNAVEKYAGIARSRAKKAVDRLLASQSVLRDDVTSSYYYLAPYPLRTSKLSEPEWIWLPNALVDGAADEIAPIKLLRPTHNLSALRLFVKLYDEHNPGQ
jgi:hypothetical protein